VRVKNFISVASLILGAPFAAAQLMDRPIPRHLTGTTRTEAMQTSDSTGIAIDATGLNLVAATSVDRSLARLAFVRQPRMSARTPERLRFAVYSLEVTMRSSVI
jgi:hypothetical protein